MLSLMIARYAVSSGGDEIRPRRIEAANQVQAAAVAMEAQSRSSYGSSLALKLGMAAVSCRRLADESTAENAIDALGALFDCALMMPGPAVEGV